MRMVFFQLLIFNSFIKDQKLKNLRTLYIEILISNFLIDIFAFLYLEN